MQGSKTRDVFPDMVVLKNPKRTQFFSDLSLPSYMRDWLVMKFSDENGDVDINRIDKYIKEYIPSREDFEQIKFRLINGEAVRFLARIVSTGIISSHRFPQRIYKICEASAQQGQKA